ncbi:LysR family transcriptional regulator [Sandaracinus amylolyticus]|uniref:LysR family transcriptional regulator n=1 Tax=Sandaracinus amylolyticus TaxID=927083 RepID=UPI001F45D7A4|nr:LysR family transcriptional regulator [Sandaracinus amylolyticus]UJR86722.1 Hypothetical protein I5071_88230 [Sandaracinus amylolyticus]
MADDLSGLIAFLAVADKRSFTAAAAELRVTPSAVSQTIRALEERVGVRLVQRTTRSVGLTEAGDRFAQRLRPALSGVHEAFESLDELRGKPTGTLRLNVPRLGWSVLIEPLLARFMAQHPELRVEIAIDDAFVDIVSRGFDAGIRIGEMLDREMVAVPISPPLRMAIVASPSYFATHPRPKHPRDLLAHDCINYRSIASGAIRPWDLVQDGRDLAIAVDGRLVTNDSDLMLRAALDGIGVAYLMEDQTRDAIAKKQLVRVLERFCPTFPGYYLYYPSRKQLAPKLAAFVQFLRSARRGASRPRPTRAPAGP